MYICFIKIKINFEQKVRLVHTIIFAFIYIIIYPESVLIDKKRIAGFSECALDLRPFGHIYFANWRDQSRVDLRHALYHFGITKQGGVRGGGTRLLHPSS